jgi:hypothetical protein
LGDHDRWPLYALPVLLDPPPPRYREILERKKRSSESARDDSLIIDDESLQSNSYRMFEPAEEVRPERLAVNASSKDYDVVPKATIA